MGRFICGSGPFPILIVALGAMLLLGLGCTGAQDESTEEGSDSNGDSSNSNGVATCTSNERVCLDDFNFQVCRADGSGFDFGTCSVNMPCRDGLCSGGTVSNGNTSNGNTSNGNTSNGNTSNGNTSNGNTSNGNTSNGNTSNGNTSNGNTSNGNTSNGNTSNGDTSNGSVNEPCMPGQRRCVNDTLLEACRPDGTGYDTGTCLPDNPCRDGYCGGGGGTPGACIGDARECLDNRTLRVCRSNGMAWDNLPCPGNQFCEDSACRELLDCVDNDRDGYGEGSDCLGPDCNDNAYIINPSGWEVCGNGEDEDCVGGDVPCDCDPISQNCPDELRCGLRGNTAGDGIEFACMGPGLLGETEPCGGIPSNCQAGLICITTDEAQGAVCTRMCNPNSGMGCIGDAVCGATLTGFDDVGLCVGLTRCDPVDNPNICPAGTNCAPYSDRDAACFDGGGALGENAGCQANNDQCGPGLACITTSDQGAVCKAFCKVNRGNADCATRQGRACAPIEFSFTFLGRTETIRAYGICNN